jgi:hypothetical protein
MQAEAAPPATAQPRPSSHARRRTLGREVVGCYLQLLRSNNLWYRVRVEDYNPADGTHLLRFFDKGGQPVAAQPYDINHPARRIRFYEADGRTLVASGGASDGGAAPPDTLSAADARRRQNSGGGREHDQPVSAVDKRDAPPERRETVGGDECVVRPLGRGGDAGAASACWELLVNVYDPSRRYLRRLAPAPGKGAPVALTAGDRVEVADGKAASGDGGSAAAGGADVRSAKDSTATVHATSTAGECVPVYVPPAWYRPNSNVVVEPVPAPAGGWRAAQVRWPCEALAPAASSRFVCTPPRHRPRRGAPICSHPLPLQARVTAAEDPHGLLYRRVRVYWPTDKLWYIGRVLKYE